jgi:hypothetical protein
MNEIARLYPNLPMAHMRTIAQIVANQRDGVADVVKVYKAALWGVACLKYQVVKEHLEGLDRAGTYQWLRYVQEQGLAYTLCVGGVPFRLQPPSDEIRDVMLGEFVAIREQTSLFADGGNPNAVLRLEVGTSADGYVRYVTLFLFDMKTGIALDSERLYEKVADSEKTNQGALVPLARPAKDVDTSNVFTFPSEKKKSDDGRDG